MRSILFVMWILRKHFSSSTDGPLNWKKYAHKFYHTYLKIDLSIFFLFVFQTIPSRTYLSGNNHSHCFVTCFDFSDELLAVGYGNGVVDVVGRKSIEETVNFSFYMKVYTSFSFFQLIHSFTHFGILIGHSTITA